MSVDCFPFELGLVVKVMLTASLSGHLLKVSNGGKVHTPQVIVEAHSDVVTSENEHPV